MEKRICSWQSKLSGFLNVSVPAGQTKQSRTPAVLRMASQYTQVHMVDILSACPAQRGPNLFFINVGKEINKLLHLNKTSCPEMTAQTVLIKHPTHRGTFTWFVTWINSNFSYMFSISLVISDLKNDTQLYSVNSVNLINNKSFIYYVLYHLYCLYYFK